MDRKLLRLHHGPTPPSDLEKLSLSQSVGGRPTASPLPNPRKRASVMDEALADGEMKRRDGTIRRRRAKALYGGPSPNWDPEYDRRTTLDKDLYFDRQKAGLNRRQYDPATDSLSRPTASAVQTIGNHDNTRRLDDPTIHFSRRKDGLDIGKEHNWRADSSPSPQAPMQSGKPAPEDSRSVQASAKSQTSLGTPAPIKMLLQPETRPISHSHAQLAVEVKAIYAGLVMVEAKCVDVDEKQSIAALEKDPTRQTKLSNEQWQALIALHRTLLHEHHDFFLAPHHPSAGPELTRLAARYSMPAQMWRHGIHSFLEVLRHRLPDSLDHMLAFIYIAYSMMALLYETVTAFEDTWIECLGDLGRYRMAIEDVDRHDREVWSGVARFWYSKAADRNPQIGRLYHHLAILARPGSFEQLSFYTRSLTCTQPFTTARTSILTVLKPALAFIYIAYSMMALLHENVTAFGDTWIECLGDLGRYRMAIENHEPDGVLTSWAYRLWKTSSFLPKRAVQVLGYALSAQQGSASRSENGLAPEDDDPDNASAPWAYRPLKASFSLPKRALQVLGFALSIRQASASSSGNGPPLALNTSHDWPFGPNVPSFSSWPFLVFGMLLAGLTPLLARSLGPSRVSGTMMAVFGFVWLRINGDEATTPVVLWTTCMLGIFFMLYYADLQARGCKMTHGYVVIALLLGIVLDYGAALLSSSPITGVSLDDLTRFSLLAFSLSLFITKYAASQAHHHHGSSVPMEAIRMEEGLPSHAAATPLPSRSARASSSGASG